MKDDTETPRREETDHFAGESRIIRQGKRRIGKLLGLQGYSSQNEDGNQVIDENRLYDAVASFLASKHFNERPLEVTSATLAEDRRTVRLTIPELRPTWGMEMVFRLRTSDGREIRRVIHNTIHYQDSHLASEPAPQSN